MSVENRTVNPVEQKTILGLISGGDLFERTYARLKARALGQDDTPMTMEDAKHIDMLFTNYLGARFNDESGAHIPKPNQNIEKTLRQENEQRVDPAEKQQHFSEINNGSQHKNTLQGLIENTPSLKDFALDDAEALVSTEPQDIFRTMQKFPDVNQHILFSVSAAMVQFNRDELIKSGKGADLPSEEEIEMRRKGEIFGLKKTGSYDEWSSAKQNDVIRQITSDPEIMADIAKIKSPLNLTTAKDVVEQAAIRERIADKVTEIYANAYDLDTLDKQDTSVTYASMNNIVSTSLNAYSHSYGVGLENDETVVVRYNPVASLLMGGENLAASDTEEVNMFMSRLFEEVQHTVDNIHADKLVKGELSSLPEDHPLIDHALKYTLNRMHYETSKTDDQSMAYARFDQYQDQYVEQSAKQSAEITASAIIAAANKSTDIEAPQQNQDSPEFATNGSQQFQM